MFKNSNTTSTVASSFSIGLALALAVFLMPALSWAQASFAISDFESVGFLFLIDGNEVEGAEVYQSRAAGSFLILASELEAPVMVKLRDAQVVTVDLMKVNRSQDGHVELLPDATLASQGSFQVNPDRSGVAFAVNGRPAELREKPALLGMQSVAGLESYSPEYKRGSDSYRPSDPIVNKLRDQTSEIKVTIYFGTWCGACKQMVPRIMKVAEQLEGSNVKIEFYGLPPGISSDPEAGRIGIEAVPTGVIYVDGKEAGRISGGGWKVPELALNNLLVQNQSS